MPEYILLPVRGNKTFIIGYSTFLFQGVSEESRDSNRMFINPGVIIFLDFFLAR